MKVKGAEILRFKFELHLMHNKVNQPDNAQ